MCHRLGSAYEQELKKKLYTTLSSKAEINDLCEKLLAKNSEYLEREEDIGNKISQLNASSAKVRSQLISERKSHSESRRELEAKYTAEIKSLKSNIKTLKREATLAQKASSADKVTILSLETKIRELEGKLEDIDLERTYHDLDVMGGVIEEPVQISSSDPKEIDSLRLELKRANEDLSSKEYTIECMGKGIESSDSIYKRELDIRSSEQLKLMEENRLLRNHKYSAPPMNDSSQPSALNPSSQLISVGSAEAVPLPKATAPILASSLMSPIIIYSILTLLLLEIIWIV
ncbi:18755_t:CDS:2 [Rhizophagus irregularis]|nr:18755_t:CDS:2 [Rhizophagus irregularis]